MSESSVEQRLDSLEREVTRLKLRAKGLQPKDKWISAITGTAQNDPVYDEICQLGKEMRDAEQPSEE